MKGKKWCWPYFIMLLTHKKTCYFLRSIVQSYLHIDKIAPILAPDIWKSRKQIADSHLTGCSHWPVTLEKQQRCHYPSCGKVCTVCEECDVALCMKGGHFKSYHTTK